MDDNAGFELIKYVRENVMNLPTVLQSSNPENAKKSYELKTNFINKNSESLLQDLKSFINYHLGFGHFVYRDNEGRQIAVAKSMAEFEAYLKTVPDDSLIYHAVKNQFSLWLNGSEAKYRLLKLLILCELVILKAHSNCATFLSISLSFIETSRKKARLLILASQQYLKRIILLAWLQAH
jgi:hypothetical protein